MSKLYVVGIGPGSHEDMTLKANRVLEKCDTIVGYTVYVELIKEFYPDKKFMATPMKGEVERCRMALEEAGTGKEVAVVCSGDSVVYGMAALLYELSTEYENVEIEVVPGVTAALSGGAILGAPLTHDFVVISLSDLLTDFELIKNRCRYAAMGDFAIAIYNPSSKKRGDYLRQICEILLEYKDKNTVCGWVKNISRKGQEHVLTTLGELKDMEVDMFTTVFVGNSQTKNIGGKMVTPRGYRI